MSRRKIVMVGLLWCLSPLVLFGQESGEKTLLQKEKGSISGTVQDSSGGRLPSVLLSIKGLEVSAATDERGAFALPDVPVGNLVLIVALSGFTTKDIPVTVQVGRDTVLSITLELASQEFSVSVTQTLPKLMSASESIGVVQVLPEQMATLPSLGEKDIFRSLQLMPGISATNEASSGLYVRGGTPDQNLVLFDGFTVYDVDHFFGIFSAFNASAVENVSMYKGGYESKYGGRLSSVVEMTGKGNNKEKMAFGGGIGLMSYNAYLNGPLGKVGSYMFAGRRSYQSPLSNKIRENYSDSAPGGGPGGGGRRFNEFISQPKSWFYDLNGRIALTPSSTDKVILSFFNGIDDFDNSRTINRSMPNNSNLSVTGKIVNLSQWGNTASSLRWHRDWNSRFSSDLTLAASRYFKNGERSSEMETKYVSSGSTYSKTQMGSTERNRVYDTTLRWQNLLIPQSQHVVEFGAEFVRNTIRYDFDFNQNAASITRKSMGDQIAVYLQDRWQLGKKFEFTPGLRATRYNRIGEYYLEPRLSFILHVSDKLRLKAAGGQYHQFVRNLVREDPMQGDQDFWTMADGQVVPVGKATHYIGGASYETEKYLFDVEAYRKNLTGLAEFASLRLGRFRRLPPIPGNPPPAPVDFTRLFFTGTGRADGVELLAQKKFGTNTGWLTYTYGKVLYVVPGLSSIRYPASHDSTHEVKIVDSHSWRNLVFSGSWIFATGKPFTEPTGVEEITLPNGRIISIPKFGDKNGARLPAYQRLDLSATWNFYTGETNAARLGFSVFNATNHANIWKREYDSIGTELLPTDVQYLGWTISAFLSADLGLPSYTARGGGPAWWTKEEAADKNKQKLLSKLDEVFDFYGTVMESKPGAITIQTKRGTQEFLLSPNTLKGEAEYESGAFVHIYYQRKGQTNLVSQIFRKVDKSHPDKKT